MDSENGALVLGTGVDMSGLEKGLKEYENKIGDFGKDVAGQVDKISELLSNVPNIDLGIDTKNIHGFDEIEEALSQIDEVTKKNKEAVKLLTDEYERLGKSRNGTDKETKELIQMKAAINANINIRKSALSVAEQTKKKLLEIQQQRIKEVSGIMEETKEVQKTTSAFQKHNKETADAANNTMNIRQRMKDLQMEMANLVANGIDEQSEHYQKLTAELGRLRDIQGDINTQGAVFANDQAHFQGVLSGLSGLTGGFSAAQGAVALFSDENEDLQRVMLKVQSLIAITTGLQQVSNAVNKDSALTLVYINKLKTWWNNITAEGAVKEAAETAATTANTTANVANSVAQTANTTAKAANATATGKETATVAANTVGQAANATAATASATAHVGLAGALRMVGAAMKSIPLAGWLLAGISALVAGITFLVDKLGEAKRKQEELYKATAEQASQPISTIMSLKAKWDELGDNLDKKKKFIEENRQKFDELGVSINGVKDAENLLMNNTDAFIKAQIKKAESLALISTQADNIKMLAENRQKEYASPETVTKRVAKKGVYAQYEYKDVANPERQKLKKENDELEAEILKTYKQAAKAESEGVKLLKSNGMTASKEYVTGSLGAIKAELSRREEDLNNAVDFKDYQKKLKGVNELQSAIDNITSPKGSIAALNAQISQKEKELNNAMNAVDYNRILKDIKSLKNELTSLTTTKGSLSAINAQISQKESELAEATSAADYKKRLNEIKKLRKEAGRITGETENNEKQAALNRKKAEKSYSDAVKKYVTDAENEITNKSLESQQDGLQKEINNITNNVEKQKKAWQDKLKSLAEARKQSLHDVYMTNDNATEVGWSETEAGKKTTEEYMKDLMNEEPIAKAYSDYLLKVEEEGNRKVTEARQKYADAQIEQYGSVEEKIDLVRRKWADKMATLPSQYLAAATKQMNEEIATLMQEDFKKSINWDAVFGNLSEQSLPALEMQLEKVKKHLSENMGTMDDQSIKNYTEAIAKMEEEIASRNPFTALHQSLKQIQVDKEAYIQAMEEMKQANVEMKEAENELKATQAESESIQELVASGELEAGCEAQVNAQAKVNEATEKYAKAKEKSNRADNNAINATNKLSSTYKKFANNLKNVGNTVSKVGTQAATLASIFKTDVGNSIKKAVEFTDEIMSAATDVVSAIGDVGKKTAKTVEDTVEATAGAMQGTSKAAATSISTVEKASVILTVISAALQVATAIANLISSDDDKDKAIAKYQQRIDELKWELENEDAMRLKKKYGSAWEEVSTIVKECRNDYQDLYMQVAKSYAGTSEMSKQWAQVENKALEKSIERVASAYAKIEYSASKALGSDKYESAQEKLKNYAEQQVNLLKQIETEQDKKAKNRDDKAIFEYQQAIEENKAKMASILSEYIEDIMGGTAQDIATELGNAFFDACEAGENAMTKWGETANEIVANVIKKMMITNFLEKPIGEIFNKYQERWYSKDDGSFIGMNAVNDSMDELVNDLNYQCESFGQKYAELQDSLKNILDATAERSGTSKGIATASQESVDENNARLTTIQGHTYTLVQGLQELNGTANAILDHVAGIERNTDSLEDMSKDVRLLRNTVDDIQRIGINVRA